MLNLETAQQFLMTRGLDFGLNLLAAIVLWFVGRWAIRIGTRLLGKVVRRSGKVDPTLTDYLTSVVGVLLTILLILAILAAGISGIGAGYPVLGVVVAVGAVWTGAFGPVATLYQAAAVRTRSTNPELAGAWINATCNVGIAAGAALGGAILEAAGLREVAWLAAALVAGALGVALVSRRAFPRIP